MTKSLLLLGALALTGCSPLYFRTLNAGGNGDGVTTTSIDYAPGRGLDLYVPASGSEPAPVVLFLYGGRWQDGSRSDYAFVGRKLAAHGVLAVVADY